MHLLIITTPQPRPRHPFGEVVIASVAQQSKRLREGRCRFDRRVASLHVMTVLSKTDRHNLRNMHDNLRAPCFTESLNRWAAPR